MIRNGKAAIIRGRLIGKKITTHSKKIKKGEKRFRKNVLQTRFTLKSGGKIIKDGKRIIKRGRKIGKHVIEHTRELEEEARRFRKEIQKNVATAILAAFGFIIALVWRDAIQESIDNLLKILNLTGTGYFYRILTAVIVTLVCVFGIMRVSVWAETEKK